MKYSDTKQGRVFVVRLHDGDILHECIEKLAKENNINAATVSLVGGVGKGSKLVVGPEDANAEKINPVIYELDNAYEATGTGTIFPDEEGNPVLHMHIACGRKGHTVVGCVRTGVICWLVLEVIITELIDCTAERVLDKNTGFKLMEVK